MPAADSPVLQESIETRTVYVTERPMTFDQFLETFGPKDDAELVNGVPQRRMAADLQHELLFAFLIRLLGDYAEQQNLGVVLGSRTAVRISSFGARLPDLLFVRSENVPAMQSGGRFVPDLVLEIVSPGDRPSELLVLESDYRAIGVGEIIFIDRRRSVIQVLRRLQEDVSTPSAYAEETVTSLGSAVELRTLGGISLQMSWLLTESPPDVKAALTGWLSPGAE